MVWPGGAEDLHDTGHGRLSSSTHIQRLDREPHRVNADQRSSSRNQLAHASAALVGHDTVIVVEPRCTSMRIGAGAGAGSDATGIGTGMKPACAGIGASSVRCASAVDDWDINTQRRSRLALMLLAIATAAIDNPGCLLASTTRALNSSLWIR